ncbi:MAG: cellulose biosynthesis protein BcsG [bacterium]|nr:cellulose biosynthesis protein BcsG [bacterium]
MNFKMGLWNFYFLAKIYLYLSGNIRFDLFLNLLFAAFIISPVPQGLKFLRQLKILKALVSVLIAIALLWRDSWLPSPLAAYEHLLAEGIPSGEYIISFILRYFVNYGMAALICGFILCSMVRNWKYLTPLTLALVLASPAYELLETGYEERAGPSVREEIFEEVRSLARLEPEEIPLGVKEVLPEEIPLGVKEVLPEEETVDAAGEENIGERSDTETAEAPKQNNEAELSPSPASGLPDAPRAVIKKGSANDWKPIGETDPQRYAEAFFQREFLRKIEFRDIKMGQERFDILFIHICSLSWDDLEGTTLNWKKFFKQFQLLFTDFNAVTSYSGPSLQRLLTSNCGQRRHAELYDNSPDDCYLFPGLRMIGYENFFPANHDGKYGDYARNAKKFGRLDAPLIDPAENNLPVRQRLFDESPVYDDYAALENWWKLRLGSKVELAAAYYNTATLHDGSYRVPKREDWLKRSKEVKYNEFADKLFKDIDKFFSLLKRSGRNVVVVFIPEHGMALKGSKIQIAGLRDIPLPQINVVPVGIKFFGKRFNKKRVSQTIISKPTSYMAITSALAAMFEKSPFGPEPYDPAYLLENIVQTDHVYENEGALVVKPGQKYMIYDKRERWTKLPIR